MDGSKILVLRLSAVGDVIRTLPAVKALKEYSPNSTITWVVEEPSKTLLESQPEIDEVILFPRRRWAEGIRSPQKIGKTLGEMGRFIKALRKREFDVVLDFHGILKSGLLSFFSGASKRIGFDRRSTKEGNFLFSNVKVTISKEKISRYLRNFELLKGIGLEVRDFKPNLYIPQEDKRYVDSYFKNLSVSTRRPWIAIHPGTSTKTPYKRWMPQYYGQLADRLIRELKATVIFTWGPGELKWVESIQNMMKEFSLLAPRTETLTQLGEVLRRCNLYIGGDTGPLHIASLLGIPVVAIYGPTDPIVNEPLGRYIMVRKDVGCNPCRNRYCEDLSCLKSITVEDVFKATKEIFSIT
ncbi:MAG: glycosyltransferase family 9 protein [Thermodesulfobacteriota bacterium]